MSEHPSKKAKEFGAALVLQGMALAVLIGIIALFANPTPKKWVEIPAYPGIDRVISRDEQEDVRRIEFTSTASVTETLAWYDATFNTNGWRSTEPHDSDRRYEYARRADCTLFVVNVTGGNAGHLTESASWSSPRQCNPNKFP